MSAPSRRAMALRGLLVIGVGAAGVGLAAAQSTGRVGADPEVVALVRDAGGSLAEGADVKSDGVVVGRVARVQRADEPGPGGATVEVVLRIEEDRLDDLPAGVVARILPATVFGTSYVDLVPAPGSGGGADGDRLEAGDVVPPDLGQRTLELQQALDDIDGLVAALGPAELNAALGAAATALDGRGEQIGSLVDRLDAYLAALEPSLPVLQEDVALLADAAALLRRNAPGLLATVEDLLVTARTVVEQRDDLVAVLAGGTALAEDGSRLLALNARTLERFLEGTVVLVDALHDNRVAAIREAALANSAAAAAVRTVLGEGDFALTKIRTGLDVPDYYGPEDRPTFGGGR